MQRSNSISSKPEYVLKRANDLIKSAYGNNADREKMLALEQLHNVISNKRKGATWTKVHEELMKRHIELCVDLKEHRLVKDGLHQYRNLCQNVEPISLEYVINHLIDLSEKRTNEARGKANKVALAAAAKVADLDQEESPESILLSSMTEEASKQRTDREVVVPWLKFLWETYRTVLELLHKNTKYDRLYHKTCEKAFKFCEDYKRTMEFRRLCEILRIHLSNLQKLTMTTTKANKPVFEWTPEIIDLHLKTRLEQLEVATGLEQWNEGFRIVEDIYSIMTSGKKTPKPRVMAAYYEKLTRIFWVSENYLFHAYAWFKYYCLVTESKKEMKPEDKSILASNVLLAALIIPSFHEVDATTAAASNMSAETDDIIIEKNAQMAMLLDFQANPTRQNLLADIIAKGIHRDVIPDLIKLYDTLEVQFQPLHLPTNIIPIVNAILSHPTLHIYNLPLQQVAVLRVVQQLSKVYGTIKISKVQSILSPFTSLTYTQIEKLMIDGVVKKQLHVRIDHINHCLKFGSSSAIGQAAETQVVQLGVQLNQSLFQLNNHLKKSSDIRKEIQSRREYLSYCASSAHPLFLKSLQRKGLIDELKQAIELAQQKKEETDRIRKEEIERQRLEEMKKRLDIERDAREKQRQLQEELRHECERLAAEIERYNAYADVEELIKMDPNARQAVLTKAKSDYLKFKDEQQRKLVEQARRLDFITRAQRLESVKAIKENYLKRLELDRKVLADRHTKNVEELSKQHAENLVMKEFYSRMQPYRALFERKFVEDQRRRFENDLEQRYNLAIKEYRDEKLNQARRLRQRELDRIRLEQEVERQRLAKEESDRIAREQDERLRKQRAEEEAAQRERETEEEKRRDRRYVPPGAVTTSGSAYRSGQGIASRESNEPSNWRQSQPSISNTSSMPLPPVPISAAESAPSWRSFGASGRTLPHPPSTTTSSATYGTNYSASSQLDGESSSSSSSSWKGSRKGPENQNQNQNGIPNGNEFSSRGAPEEKVPSSGVYVPPRPSDFGEKKSGFGRPSSGFGPPSSSGPDNSDRGYVDKKFGSIDRSRGPPEEPPQNSRWGQSSDGFRRDFSDRGDNSNRRDGPPSSRNNNNNNSNSNSNSGSKW